MVKVTGTGKIYKLDPKRYSSDYVVTFITIESDGGFYYASYQSTRNLEGLKVGDTVKFTGVWKVKKKRQRDGTYQYWNNIELDSINLIAGKDRPW